MSSVDYNSSDVVIVAAQRSPVGSFNGALSTLKAHELGAIVIREILVKTKQTYPDDVIIGQALTAGQGQNPARQASINAGVPNSVTATTINMLCGSGLKACALGYQAIKAGEAKVVLCGGQESMSQAPHFIYMRKETKMGDASLVDTMLKDGLTDAFENIHMGLTAEMIAEKYSITRAEQDKFAFESQRKYKEAFENKAFENEIVAVTIKARNSEKKISADEYPRLDTSIEGLSKLKACFKSESAGGTVTAGNASGINDGAAMLMLASYEEVKQKGLDPMCRIVSWAQHGCEPKFMGLCPIDAVRKALEKAGWKTDDVDLFEINEAFASQSIAVVKSLGLDEAKVNVNGGAIAIGHPIGCSGARVLVTLIHQLINKNKKRGVAALCVGGGMGIAMCVERL